MTSRRDRRFDAVVVGGGVIGLACAWRAARRGLRGLRARARARSAPAPPASPPGCSPRSARRAGARRTLLALNLASLGCGPRFAAELEAESGRRGRLSALRRAPRRARPRRGRGAAPPPRAARAARARLRVAAPGECRALEPGLAPAVARRAARARRGRRRTRLALRGPGRGARAAAGGEIEQGAEVVGADRRRRRRAGTCRRPRRCEAAPLVLATGCLVAARRMAARGGAPAGAPGQGRDPDPARRRRATRSASGSSPASASTSSPAPTAG